MYFQKAIHTHKIKTLGTQYEHQQSPNMGYLTQHHYHTQCICILLIENYNQNLDREKRLLGAWASTSFTPLKFSLQFLLKHLHSFLDSHKSQYACMHSIKLWYYTLRCGFIWHIKWINIKKMIFNFNLMQLFLIIAWIFIFFILWCPNKITLIKTDCEKNEKMIS